MPHRLRGASGLATTVRSHDDNAALICEHHSGALFSLACLLLREREAAESVVVQVVADACTDPDLDDNGSLRRRLARLTYQQCLARSTATIDPKQASLALVTVGDHTYKEAAEVMGLPGETVAGLLTDALRAAKQPVR